MTARKKARPQGAESNSMSDGVRSDARDSVSDRMGDRMGDNESQRTAGSDDSGGSGGSGDSVSSVGRSGSNGVGESSRSSPMTVERSRQLLQNLFHELFQTEQSAALHPQREARRLGTVPPADALQQVAEHASRVLGELPELAERRKLPVSRIGQLVGLMFSNARHWFADRLIEPERSYRGTLLGMRHGVDLVTLIRDSALVEGDAELAEWCTRWLVEREPLVEAVAAQLQWFAETPEAALGSTAWSQAEQLLERLSSLLLNKTASGSSGAPARPASSTVH